MPNPVIAITGGSKHLNLTENPAAALGHCQADCQSSFGRRNAFICLFGLVVSGQFYGQIAPRADAVWDQARIVVLGRVLSASATDLGQQAKGGYLGVVTRVDIVLQTNRCYKNAGVTGECERLTTFFYDWPQLGNTSRRLLIGDDAVIFITDHAGPLTAEDPDGVWPLNGLVQGLGRREQDLLPRGKAGLQDDLSAALSSADGDLRRQGFFYLQGFTALSPQAMAEAKRLVVLDSESIDERLAALSLMLTDPQLKTVAIAASMAETEGKTIIASPLASLVGLSLGNVSDPSCVPALIKVVESSVESWHYGAISGLRRSAALQLFPR